WFRAPRRLRATRRKGWRTPACRAGRRQSRAAAAPGWRGWSRRRWRRARFYGAWSSAETCKGRTLTAVLRRAPAMPSDIHPIVMDRHTFTAQSRALLLPGGAADGQAEAAA